LISLPSRRQREGRPKHLAVVERGSPRLKIPSWLYSCRLIVESYPRHEASKPWIGAVELLECVHLTLQYRHSLREIVDKLSVGIPLHDPCDQSEMQRLLAARSEVMLFVGQ